MNVVMDANADELRYLYREAREKADKAVASQGPLSRLLGLYEDDVKALLANAEEAEARVREALPRVRQMSTEDRAALKGFYKSNSSWFARNIIASEPKYPRRLYLQVLRLQMDLEGGPSLCKCIRVSIPGGKGSAVSQGKNGPSPTFGDVWILEITAEDVKVDLDVIEGDGDDSEVKEEPPEDTSEVKETLLAQAALSVLSLSGNTPISLPLNGPIVEEGKDLASGALQVIAFWVDEAQPLIETGVAHFYRVLRPVKLLKQPLSSGDHAEHAMARGEIVSSRELQRDLSDDTTYVKVEASLDKWGRSGFIPTKGEKGGDEILWLKELDPPTKEIGHFFYRVKAEEGFRLFQRPDEGSSLQEVIHPKGAVLEAKERYTPVDSSIAYCAVTGGHRGFIFERPGQAGVRGVPPELEATECPSCKVITHEKKHYIYRVTNEGPLSFQAEACITGQAAPGSAKLQPGAAFSVSERVVKRYSGMGEVLFLRKDKDKLWTVAARGEAVYAEQIKDQVIAGEFLYQVVHENGLVLRSQADLNAPPAPGADTMSAYDIFKVDLKLMKAEDIATSSSPSVFLRLAAEEKGTGESWAFESRGRTVMCKVRLWGYPFVCESFHHMHQPELIRTPSLLIAW
ncbi:unnamed protein product [Chrysoparadoxa australica]